MQEYRSAIPDTGFLIADSLTYDYLIDLQQGAIPPRVYVFLLAEPQTSTMKSYIQESVMNDHIHLSMSH